MLVRHTTMPRVAAFNGTDLKTNSDCLRIEVTTNLIAHRPTNVDDVLIGESVLKDMHFTVVDSFRQSSVSTKIICHKTTPNDIGTSIRFSTRYFAKENVGYIFPYNVIPFNFDTTCNDTYVITNTSENLSEYDLSTETTWECSNVIYLVKQGQEIEKRAIGIHHFTFLLYPSMGLSCASLFSSIITFRLMSLSNAPSGRNVMQVLVNSFIMLILMIASLASPVNKYKHLCTVFGILIHFFGLSVCSHLTFGIVSFIIHVIKESRRRHEGCRHLLRLRGKILFSLGYIVPIFIMMPCIGLEFSDFVDLKPGYTNSFCIPMAHPLLFTAGPAMTFTLASLVFFAILKFRARSLVLNEVQEIFISMFAKVTMIICLLVISWVGWEITQNILAAHIFIVMFGLHGVLFSLSCFCNRNVLNNCYQCCCGGSSSNLPRIRHQI